MGDPSGDAQTPPPSALDGPLFELNSPGWLERLRSAVVTPALGHIGPYELLEEVGRGGQGEVYRAIQPGTGRTVALKRIAGLGLAPSEHLRARFAREIEAIRRLSHPAIVTVYAAELIEGHTVLIMELIEGRPIDRWADERWSCESDALREVLTAFAQACDGVAHAHSRAVIHRDIKPGNILVTPAGEAKVLDFGIAKVLDEHHQQAATASIFMGTPGYAAPERLREGAAEADTRSDVYSLGVVLFRILSGREAFAPLASAAIDRRESAGMPSRHRSLPRECDWIVEKATSADPARRYQSVEALARDVRALLSGQPVEAAPPSTTYRLRKTISRYRFAAIGASVVVLTLIAATAVSLTAASRARAALLTARDQSAATLAALARESEALEASRAAEQRALVEAARQTQVTALLQSILGSSSRRSNARPDITVREALDRAVENYFPVPAERSPTLDPPVEAAVRSAIGETYLGIGRNEEAMTHLSAAAELYNELEGEHSKRTISTLYLIGRNLRVMGRLSEAEPVLRRVANAYRTRPGDNRLALAEVLSSLGICLRRMGRSHDAEAAYREAMELYFSLQGESHGVASMCNNIAILTSHRGDHHVAEEMSRKAVRIFGSIYSGGNLDYSNAVNVLGNVLWVAGHYEEGEHHLRRSIELDRQMMPTPEVAHAQKILTLADRLAQNNQFNAAAEVCAEGLAMVEQVAGASSTEALTARVKLASLLRRGNRALEGLVVCLESPEPPTYLRREAALLHAERAECLAALGRHDEAESSFCLAWESYPSETPAVRAHRQLLAARLAEYYESIGRQTEAEMWRALAQAPPPAGEVVDGLSTDRR